MRYNRLTDNEVEADYSICCRIVDRQFKFDEKTRDSILEILWEAADFSGVTVIDFALMSNHFHLQVRVKPKATAVGRDEVVRRVGVLYGEKKRLRLEKQLGALVANGEEDAGEMLLAPFRARMNDLSEFMKSFKQRVTMRYNNSHNRTGTLWEGRFRSTLIERTADLVLLRKVAAYMDLNPMRAGIADAPESYRWCGFGLACIEGKRGERGRGGLALLYPGEDPDSFLEKHRALLLARFRKKGMNRRRPAMDDDFSGRQSCMTFSRVIGSRAFVARAVGKRPPGGMIPLADGYVAVGRERRRKRP